MSNSLERGYLLHRRYRIVEILGQGGMGSVYRAVDENLGTDVAVKENLFTTDEYARQFRLEAVILANLRQANLPRVTDHFVVGEQGQYLIMDYIEGEDLRQRMERSGPVSEEETVLIGAAMCDALDYLHTRKPCIIHRDIKPGNVRIAPDGHIYLVDFGLAKLLKGSQATTTGARAMTPGYSPPEQYGTARTDPRTDIYSLGATLYASVTGIIPEDALARAMDNVELTPVRRHNPRVSRKLAAAIEKSMAISPDDRFQTAFEFKEALLASSARTQHVEGEIVVQPPPPDDNYVETDELEPSHRGGGDPMAHSSSRPRPSKPRKKKKPFNKNFYIFISFFFGSVLITVLSLILWWSPATQLVGGWLGMRTSQAGDPLQMSTTVLSTEGTSSTSSVFPTHTATLTPSLTPTATTYFTETISPTATFIGGGYGQLAIVSDRTGTPQIYVINADGSGFSQVTNLYDGACQPDWSPDGQRLIFISPCLKRQDTYPEAHIFIVNVDGSGLTELILPAGSLEPAWSPDGVRIAFSNNLSGMYQIYLFNLADNMVTQLTEKTEENSLPDWSRHPAWSPSGTQLIYTGHSQLTGAMQIWVMSDAGRGKTRLVLNDVTFWDFQPAWGSDGRMIYFSETEGAQALGWLMEFNYENRDDPDADQLTNGKFATDITISPDMQWLAFETTEDGKNYFIEIMMRDGTNRAPLTNDPDMEYDPAWRPGFLP